MFMPVFSHTVSIDEHDLRRVLKEMKSVSQMLSLGLALGLVPSAIDVIQKDFGSVKQQNIEVIKCWLNHREIILNMQSCCPTWSVLVEQ